MIDNVMRELSVIIGQRFGVPPESVTTMTTSEDVDGWDSVSHASLLIEVEDAFGIEIPVEMGIDFENVGNLADFVGGLLEDK